MPANSDDRPDAGTEWLIDATGCEPRRLADPDLLRGLLDAVVFDLDLKPLGPGQWHTFPPPGGLTGMVLLAESHLTVHTWPEFGTAAFNLFCCRPRPPWPWKERLSEMLGAEHVEVRCVERSVRKEAAR
jgi:S-adenosylmethionine decarboxylase